MINFAIKLAATVALEAVSIGLQASQRTQGPRLSETQVTTADYGTPLPEFLGERRLAGQIVWSKDLEIVDHTHKVKGGGKQTTESALWTAGVAFANCRHTGPIDKVLKIWFDETLAYDATGTGPPSYASSLGIDLASVMRIYTGASDQAVDPAYSDFCEAKYGPNSAPAFRGTAMLVFDKMPLDNFGNRPPQISVLATSDSLPSFPYEIISAPHYGLGLGVFSRDFTRFATADSAGSGFYALWDIPTRTLLTTGSWPSSIGVGGFVYTDEGDIFLRPDATHVQTLAGDFSSAGAAVGLANAADTIWYAGGYGCLSALTGHTFAQLYDGAAVSATDVGFKVLSYLNGPDGLPWAIGVSGTNIRLRQLGGAETDLTVANAAGGGATPYGLSNSAGNIALFQGTTILVIDTAGTILHSGTRSGTIDRESIVNHNGSDTIWSQDFEYSLLDGSLIRSFPYTDWTSGRSSNMYDPVNIALFGRDSGGHLNWLYLDRAGNNGTTLGAIVAEMCNTANLTVRDTSLLTQFVAGYSWTRGDVKSQMEPLLDIHDVDARPHDFEIQFLPRGSAPAGTILTADFAKAASGADRYKTAEVQDTDLPQLLRVNFADTGFDQQTNNILSPLPVDGIDSQRDQVIDLTTYAASPDTAQQLGDRYMRRQLNSRYSVTLSLTAQQLAAESGDVKTLSLDGTQWNARLTKQTFTAGRIDCTFVRDETAVALLNSATTGPTMAARTVESIVIPSPVRGFVIDAPLRQDSDADVRPLLYTAAGPYAGLSFPGAAVVEETGTGPSAAFDQLFATLSTGASWGICTTTLGNIASPWLWDRASKLTVSLQSGSLTSVAEADVDADPTLNLILVGAQGRWEYVNFTTATLNGDGTYTLSGFKRGRRGTEWAIGLHKAGDAWVLASGLAAEELGTDQVGGDLAFKAQAIGRMVDAADEIDVAPFTGATLKPYAPASIKWSWDGTNLTGTITRRTRIGGAWVGGTAIPLSEASEAYEVDVYNGATFKRTISVSGTNAFTYTAAMAAADGITLPTPPSVNVYQMSDAVGRGYALAA